METLDSIYECVDYTIKIELNSKGVSTIYDTPIDPNTNDILAILHNKDGKLNGNIIVSDDTHEIRESFEMDIERFRLLNCTIGNMLDGWKRTFYSFISTKLAPMNCNTKEAKETFDISLETFLIDIDIESFYLESHIRDYETLGRELVSINELEIPVELENHVDYASYAHDWNSSEDEPKGIMTRYGFLYYSEYGNLL